MTLYFANHQITIYRSRRKGITNKYALSATLTAYEADIQPTVPERAQQYDERFGAVFDAYVDTEVSIKEGDQIVDDTGKRYSVKGVAHFESAGMLDHKQLLLIAQDGPYG